MKENYKNENCYNLLEQNNSQSTYLEMLSWLNHPTMNKMELLQSQAPVDQELLGSSASARRGTFDIAH